MSNATQHWADELNDTVSVLKTVKDELKVQLHLASMEGKARFAELERRLDNEQLNARKNFKDLVGGFRALKDEISKTAKDARDAAHGHAGPA